MSQNLQKRAKYSTKFIKSIDDTPYNFNIHLGLNQDHRIEASRLFNASAQTILNRNPNAYIMGMGNFNAFPDGGGDKQIAELTQPGILEHNSNGLFLKDTNEKVNWSFIAYPYDFVLTDPKTPRFDLDQLKNKSIDEQQETVFEFFNTKCNATCGQLDHVFSRGFQNVHVSLWPTPLHGELSEYNEETVKNDILSHKKNPAFASDHQMLRTVFTY